MWGLSPVKPGPAVLSVRGFVRHGWGEGSGEYLVRAVVWHLSCISPTKYKGLIGKEASSWATKLAETKGFRSL